MPRSTSPDPEPELEAARIPANVWAAGDASLQVPLAGLLADDQTLTTAELTAEEWQQRLDEYLRSPRP